jgi:uncharacterized protein YgiM (DUF1202 family)
MLRPMKTLFSFATICLAGRALSALEAEHSGEHVVVESTVAESSAQEEPRSSEGRQPMEPMTIRVMKDHVRLRNRADRNSPVVLELHQDDLLLADGLEQDFYAVQPPEELKAYIFRAYVLEGGIEAQNVNVRLAPSLDAPIIGRLTQGDRVETLSEDVDGKWLQIRCPESCHFFVAKDLVEQAGSAELYVTARHRQATLHQMMTRAQEIVKEEMQKPVEEMRLDEAQSLLEEICSQYEDFPQQKARAQKLLAQIRTDYLSKNVAFLDGTVQTVAEVTPAALHSMADTGASDPLKVTDRMRVWIPTEQSLIQAWLAMNHGQTPHDFYLEEQRNAHELTGQLEVFQSSARQRPGDYVLRRGNVPIAYLYSTVVNLQEQVGQTIRILGSPRSNHHFAFPAYFVHQVQAEEHSQ